MNAQQFLQKVVTRLKRHEGRYADISRSTGISYSRLTKLAQGYTDNPTIETLQDVIEALDAYEESLKGSNTGISVLPVTVGGSLNG